MAPLLVNVLAVGPLAAGASVTVAHGLNYNVNCKRLFDLP